MRNYDYKRKMNQNRKRWMKRVTGVTVAASLVVTPVVPNVLSNDALQNTFGTTVAHAAVDNIMESSYGNVAPYYNSEYDHTRYVLTNDPPVGTEIHLDDYSALTYVVQLPDEWSYILDDEFFSNGLVDGHNSGEFSMTGSVVDTNGNETTDLNDIEYPVEDFVTVNQATNSIEFDLYNFLEENGFVSLRSFGFSVPIYQQGEYPITNGEYTFKTALVPADSGVDLNQVGGADQIEYIDEDGPDAAPEPEPEDPEEPEEPTPDPEDPEPGEPTPDPEDPEEPGEPTPDPEDPEEPEEPTPDPEDPEEPGEPTPDPEDHEEPEEPTPDPEDPEEPEEPTPDPEDPEEPGEPTPDPEDPEEPGEPTPDPEDPEQPGEGIGEHDEILTGFHIVDSSDYDETSYYLNNWIQVDKNLNDNSNYVYTVKFPEEISYLLDDEQRLIEEFNAVGHVLDNNGEQVAINEYDHDIASYVSINHETNSLEFHLSDFMEAHGFTYTDRRSSFGFETRIITDYQELEKGAEHTFKMALTEGTADLDSVDNAYEETLVVDYEEQESPTPEPEEPEEPEQPTPDPEDPEQPEEDDRDEQNGEDDQDNHDGQTGDDDQEDNDDEQRSISLDISGSDSVELTPELLQTLGDDHTLFLTKDGVELAIPGSIFDNKEEPVTVNIVEQETAPNSLSKTYDFTIEQGTETINEFGDDTVTLTFDVDEDRAENLENLKVFYYNENTGEWELIGGEYSDGKVSAATSHLSAFTVFEVNDDDNVVITENGDTDKDSEEGLKVTSSDEKEDGETLPDTATNTWAYGLAGALAVVLGGAVKLINRFRRAN